MLRAPAEIASAAPPVAAPAPPAPRLRGLRVLAMIDTVAVSGPGRQLVGAAQALAAAGAAMHVVLLRRAGAPVPPFAEALAAAGIAHDVLDESGPFDRTLPARVRALIARVRPDVVETHSYKMTAVMWLLRRSGVRVPWVGFFHGRTRENAKVRFYHWLDERMLAAADRVVGMSAVHRAEFARLGVRAEVVHNAVLPLPAAGRPVDLTPYRREGPLVGVIGRLSPEKGVDVFLDACAQLAGAGERFSAVIAGEGVDRPSLEARAAALALGDRVHFLGPLADVGSLYRQLDLVVLPSRSEGLPNVLLEALAADRPVVATRVGAVPEVLDGHADAGLVVPPENPGALAEAMRRAWAFGAEPRARAARAEVAARFSMTYRLGALARLYADVTRQAA